MSVWTGWQADLLKAAGFPNTAANRAFLSAWHQHAQSSCAQNPVDISKQEPGSTNCHHLNTGRTAQNYRDPADASNAFAGQVFGSEFLNLNSGFENSSLTTGNASAAVIADLQTWGSVAFATYLQGQASASSGAAGSATGVHKGWSDLRHSVNRVAPRDLKQTDRLVASALRSLGRARKVRL